jgi:hypothetical protein
MNGFQLTSYKDEGENNSYHIRIYGPWKLFSVHVDAATPIEAAERGLTLFKQQCNIAQQEKYHDNQG